jgi:pilus assembly protein CpaF
MTNLVIYAGAMQDEHEYLCELFTFPEGILFSDVYGGELDAELFAQIINSPSAFMRSHASSFMGQHFKLPEGFASNTSLVNSIGREYSHTIFLLFSNKSLIERLMSSTDQKLLYVLPHNRKIERYIEIDVPYHTIEYIALSEVAQNNLPRGVRNVTVIKNQRDVLSFIDAHVVKVKPRSIPSSIIAAEKKRAILERFYTIVGDADIESSRLMSLLNALIVEEWKGDEGDYEQLSQELLSEVMLLGPIDALLADTSVSEIMINGPEHCYVERNGCIEKMTYQFSSSEQLGRVIEKIIAPIGRRLDESSPIVDARLPSGARVNIISRPVALDGPVMTIRKFSPSLTSLDDLVARKTLTGEEAEHLRDSIQKKKNILISGGTGSGKTTLLNALSAEISCEERIITIEDSAELQLNHAHVIRLESRPVNSDGKGEISIRKLLQNALRMRPDRIIVGECRGAESFDMLQAMNTGHSGSMTTVHANSARDALARIETLALYAGFDIPLESIQQQVSRAIDVVIHMKRGEGEKRTIEEIYHVPGFRVSCSRNTRPE